MTPARRLRIALAMSALASYPSCAEPVEEAQAPVALAYENVGRPTRPVEAADPTAGLEQTVSTAPRAVKPRASRARPRPAPPDAAPTPAGGGDVWAALARCESGGNPRAVSASGTYRGAFQFSLATWRSVGMTGDPIDHSYGEQLAAAQRLQARSGFGQWPACSRKLGLR